MKQKKMKPVYSLQIAMAMMLIIELDGNGVGGKFWIVFPAIAFGILTILNLMHEM